MDKNLDQKVLRESYWFKQLITNDLKRDKTEHLIHYYKPSFILAQIFSLYPQLIVYKSLSVISQYQQYYPEFIVWSTYDPTFMLPISVMITNYVLLNSSEHPFLINLRNDWTTTSKALLCLYSSAAFIVLPKSFSIAFLGYAVTHLLIRKV